MREGEYDSAVFHASMAAESAANAMILQPGGTQAKNHKATSALAVVMRRAGPELLKEEKYGQLIASGSGADCYFLIDFSISILRA